MVLERSSDKGLVLGHLLMLGPKKNHNTAVAHSMAILPRNGSLIDTPKEYLLIDSLDTSGVYKGTPRTIANLIRDSLENRLYAFAVSVI